MVEIPSLEYDAFFAAPVWVDDVFAFIETFVCTPEAATLEDTSFVAYTSGFIGFAIEICLIVLMGVKYVAQISQELINEFLTSSILRVYVNVGRL